MGEDELVPLLDLLGLFDGLDEGDDAGLEATLVGWGDVGAGGDAGDGGEHGFVAELLHALAEDFVHEGGGDCLHPGYNQYH